MRRNRATKRQPLPDPRHGSRLVSKFINAVMVGGKKSIAEKIVYGALDMAQSTLKKQPVEVLEEVLEAVGPKVEVKSRRVGGSTYQVPVEVRQDRRIALAMRWLIEFAKKRNEKTMTERLGKEIIDALEGRGGAMKKREETFRMAEANKAFAHYRW